MRMGLLGAFMLLGSCTSLSAQPSPVPPLTIAAGTLKNKGIAAFSFVVTEGKAAGHVQRVARLCWPRGAEYRLTVETNDQHHTFDLSFCPGKNPERVPENECLRLTHVPEIVPSTNEDGTNEVLPTAWGTSVLSYRNKHLELFIEDGLSPTVQTWLSDEWRDVDPELKRALAQCLSMAVRAPIGLGPGVPLALMAFPREEIQRFEGNEISIEQRLTPFCGEPLDIAAAASPSK